MKNKFSYLKIWASTGAFASLVVHLWRCQGQLLFWEGTSSLKPVLAVVVTAYPLLAVIFWRARTAKVLVLTTVVFFAMLPEFRIRQEREIRRTLSTIPASPTLARPALKAALSRFPQSAPLRLLQAELEIAEGNLPATRAALDVIREWPEDLRPRVGHLRYVLYRAHF